MGLLSIFKGNKKEKDCCQIEIVEVKEEENKCCSTQTSENTKKEKE
ncbi:hypothetical protein [Priestia filamentosa]|nr:hypothetical protein [Priestia filamentosa]WRU97740.1 hypothetical protein RYX51_22430 [Priestia filamentosa]SMF72027.1 hypothetical protein SAMN06296056_11340 [Priestia filamentosa]